MEKQEYYAALKGASVALGVRSMPADLGEDVRVRLYTDRAAALGVIGRRGPGKVRHVETGYLWLQDLVAKKKIGVAKSMVLRTRRTWAPSIFALRMSTNMCAFSAITRKVVAQQWSLPFD